MVVDTLDRHSLPLNATAASNTSESFNTEAYVNVVTRFDKLVEAGVVQYDCAYKTEIHNIKGIDFEFRITKALDRKPETVDSPLATQEHLRPGSDISTHGYEIEDLANSHVLAFNGFSCYRPHFLLLTQDGHRRQWEPLDLDDFSAVHAFFENYGKNHIIFFNGKKEAGCSRLHKHLQAIPRESYNGNPWHNLDDNQSSLPFVYYSEPLQPDSTAQDVCHAYVRGLEAVSRTLGKKITPEDGAPPHNMILDAGRIIVIPRRKGGVGGVQANAGGMLGMIWTSSEELKQKWLAASPWDVMEQGGCPKLL